MEDYNHVAYNTATSFVVKVTFTQSGGNASNTISVTALGSTQSVGTLASGASARKVLPWQGFLFICSLIVVEQVF